MIYGRCGKDEWPYHEKRSALFADKGNAELKNSKVGGSQMRGIVLQHSKVEFNPTANDDS